ncbi:MAG: MarR family transcriptional regulator [Paludibacterium sp.]|uniref:GbsR/MarR family transcriptional regulator n=1 Tax=Paludibacterium sp. TaxID=1917523 RepID=UPI0025CEA334|nr:MarR family transcriptional regulator [Paludibacterium sp.]MBV8048865.1 MarR family transcriptional regulator [Paludibacterium sp.]MBV8646478.1 MarR family transcriptional regulator [Paludibacterium sp.]
MKNLSPLAERLVLHFGEMGRDWGLSRTASQICALLFLSPRPLNADEIAGSLGLSRSNVGAGLKTLTVARLILQAPQPGDRREFFTMPDDAWEVLRRFAQEKRRREIEPTLQFLREGLRDETAGVASAAERERMRALYDLLDLLNTWFDDVQKLSPQTLERLMRLGSRVARVLDAAIPPGRHE